MYYIQHYDSLQKKFVSVERGCMADWLPRSICYCLQPIITFNPEKFLLTLTTNRNVFGEKLLACTRLPALH